jgi:hypothetical protein
MAGYPTGPITQLVNGLKKSPELQGYTILGSAKLMARNTAPPRINIYPTAGLIKNPRNKATANRDVDRELVAHLWGRDIDECCYLETLLVQALVNQGAGGDPVSGAGATPGLFWTATDDVWEQSEDSNRQGEEVYVRLTAVTALDKVAQRIGSVSSVVLGLLGATLAVGMASGDLMAFVASTTGFPPSGILTIDSEQMQYTGTTTTSFTGLVRGVNGTTPSTHSSGATVNVS